MLPDELLFLLLFLRLLVNQLLVDVDVLVCHLLRDSFYLGFLNQFLFHVLHEQGCGGGGVMGVDGWEKIWSPKDGLTASTVTCQVPCIKASLRGANQVLVERKFPTVVMHGY
jgi:hypothetical protein